MKDASFRRFGPLAVALAALPGCNLVCPYAPDQFVETAIRAECRFYFSCCTAGEADIVADVGGVPDLSSYRDEEHCVRERLEEGSPANEAFRGVVQAEQAGRFRYDYAAAQACSEGLINALNSCNADFVLGDARPVEQPEECLAVTGEGLVKDGAPCFFDYECAIKGSQCLSPRVLENPDTCAAPDDCSNDEECVNGFCVPEADAIIIHDEKVCVAPIPEGDSCEPNPDQPLLPPFCEAGTICLPDNDGDVTCERPRGEGDDCLTTAFCERGLFCEFGNNAQGECTPRFGEGDDCTNDDECEVGLFCDSNRAEPVCTAPLPVEVLICNGIQGGDDPAYDLDG
jgi:hypothetical protein